MSTTHPYAVRLGRLFAPDSRDWQLTRVHPLLATAPVPLHNVRWASFFRKYDQQGGTCVGHGTKEKLLVAPTIQTKRDRSPTPYEIYDWCIANDEFPDNDHDVQRQVGTSVRAGMRYLQAFGYMPNYAFEWDIDGFQQGMMVDSLVLGTNWYDSMFDADDKTGLVRITPTASIAGGHCYLCDRLDMARGIASGPQSWGYVFGKVVRSPNGPRNGRWAMALETLDRLFREDGEAATGVEIRKPKAG